MTRTGAAILTLLCVLAALTIGTAFLKAIRNLSDNPFHNVTNRLGAAGNFKSLFHFTVNSEGAQHDHA